MEEKDNEGKVLFGIGSGFTLLIVVTIAILVFLYTKNPTETSLKKIVPESAAPVAEVSPVPTTEVLNKGEVVFEVMNSSGKTGMATRYKDILGGLGFKVEKTGNLAGKHFGLELYLKKDLVDKKEMILESLKPEIVASFSGELKDSLVTARLVIGKN